MKSLFASGLVLAWIVQILYIHAAEIKVEAPSKSTKSSNLISTSSGGDVSHLRFSRKQVRSIQEGAASGDTQAQRQLVSGLLRGKIYVVDLDPLLVPTDNYWQLVKNLSKDGYRDAEAFRLWQCFVAIRYQSIGKRIKSSSLSEDVDQSALNQLVNSLDLRQLPLGFYRYGDEAKQYLNDRIAKDDPTAKALLAWLLLGDLDMDVEDPSAVRTKMITLATESANSGSKLGQALVGILVRLLVLGEGDGADGVLDAALFSLGSSVVESVDLDNHPAEILLSWVFGREIDPFSSQEMLQAYLNVVPEVIRSDFVRGKLLIYGLSGPKDEKKGLDFLRKSAKNGDPNACFELALGYLNGRGVKPSKSEAYFWILLSNAWLGPSKSSAAWKAMFLKGEELEKASKGDPVLQLLRSLEADLSISQKRAAQERATSFFKAHKR
jgi:hypothetical protein